MAPKLVSEQKKRVNQEGKNPWACFSTRLVAKATKFDEKQPEAPGKKMEFIKPEKFFGIKSEITFLFHGKIFCKAHKNLIENNLVTSPDKRWSDKP